MLEPYGGQLIDRRITGGAEVKLRSEAASFPKITISDWTLSDLYLIAVGGLSPLNGFMGRADYESVVEKMTLENGLPWSIPVTLPANAAEAADLQAGDRVALVLEDGSLSAVIDVTETFQRNKQREAEIVFRTMEEAHPGVAALNETGEWCVAGPVHYVYDEDITGLPAHNLTPAETRAEFEKRGWKTIVAFQTRNPIHRAHEYLQKCAMEMVDGLLIHPLVGRTKSDDIPADVRMECYQVIMQHYYPRDRVFMSVLPAAMRYAGPREAIFHAIMRRNYGCTHFIVGRDHAGVGSYYGTYDAQNIFDEIDQAALGIQPLKFEHSFWCTVTKQMATAKTSPSSPEQRIFLSGTKVREMLSQGIRPPEEFTRPEVADVLMKAYQGAGTA
ncbi:MAG: sulfate adenylyltransferase [Gemmatimonadota bacterium]